MTFAPRQGANYTSGPMRQTYERSLLTVNFDVQYVAFCCPKKHLTKLIWIPGFLPDDVHTKARCRLNQCTH